MNKTLSPSPWLVHSDWPICNLIVDIRFEFVIDQNINTAQIGWASTKQFDFFFSERLFNVVSIPTETHATSSNSHCSNSQHYKMPKVMFVPMYVGMYTVEFTMTIEEFVSSLFFFIGQTKWFSEVARSMAEVPNSPTNSGTKANKKAY